MDSTSRRKFLEAVAAGTAVVVAAPPLQAWAGSGGNVSPSPEPSRIVCKVGDRTLTEALAVDVGSVRIPVIKDPETGALSHGKAIWGDLTITVGVGAGKQSDAAFLASWHKQAKRGGEGGALRRDISVFLYARDKSTILRTYHAKECVPTSLDSGDQSTASEAKTLTCKVGYVEVELGGKPGGE